MTEEELKAALAEKEAEIEKLKSIKSEVVAQRDEVKHQYAEVEGKVGELTNALVKAAAQAEEEAKKRQEIEQLHLTTVKTTMVRQALEKEGVVAVDTALKLIDLQQITADDTFTINTDAVSSVVSKLKETDAVLFSKPSAPKVDADAVPKPKRASEGEPKVGFAEELKACKTQADVEALLRKNGKL